MDDYPPQEIIRREQEHSSSDAWISYMKRDVISRVQSWLDDPENFDLIYSEIDPCWIYVQDCSEDLEPEIVSAWNSSFKDCGPQYQFLCWVYGPFRISHWYTTQLQSRELCVNGFEY